MDSDSETSIISPSSSPPLPVTTNRTYQHDMLDPYFMHPSDNPSVALVSPPRITTRGRCSKNVNSSVSNSNRANSKGRGDTDGRSSGSSRRHSRYCSHCHRSGHTVDVCFYKHGFPPHFRKNGNSSTNNCVASNVDDDDHKSSCADDSLGDFSPSSFTTEQQKALLALLHTSQTSFSSVVNHLFNSSHTCSFSFPNISNVINTQSWILDTGATNHVCYYDSIFQSLKGIKHVRIRLPNGCTIITELAGTDNLSQKRIGTADLIHGLYLLSDPCLHIVSTYHKRLPFPNSTTIADCCFDLIHMDIWGPFSMPSILGYKYFLTVVDEKSRFCWLPSKFLSYKSLFHILHGFLPDISEIRVFGCLCYASTLKSNRKKFDPRSRKCIYLGHKFGTKGYILFDLHNREIFVSRDIAFFENVFPFNGSQENKISSSIPFINPTSIDFLFDLPPTPIENALAPSFSPQLPFSKYATPSPSPITTTPHPIPTRKSTRQVKPPSYLKDFHCKLLAGKNLNPHVSHLHSSGILYPLSQFISYDNLSSSHRSFILNVSTVKEPSSYTNAIKDKNWRPAIQNELDALAYNKT
ncbi:uncharacterized protein [Cicer arietinum]|uniref:Uncharacterized protein LOC101509602 n=1 Tax=Cicer arietinum TaxID=3827 RepID=A0A1S2Z7M0_CICAR|nr:uncharacterized protein LOC101509602 [Cicer arietinum]